MSYDRTLRTNKKRGQFSDPFSPLGQSMADELGLPSHQEQTPFEELRRTLESGNASFDDEGYPIEDSRYA